MQTAITRLHQGMTLIELLIVVSLLGVMGAIAYPSYQGHLERARANEAKSALLIMQMHLEQSYDGLDTGRVNGYDFSVISDGRCSICPRASDYYRYSITSAATYTLMATSSLPGRCSQLSLTQTQLRTPSECW